MALMVVRQLADEALHAPSRPALARWAAAALRHAGFDAAGRELTVRVVGEEEGRDLNRSWRGKDSPTNVLAFPGTPVGGGAEAGYPLGDLVVCAPVVEREAETQGKATDAHWCHMIVHGTLHLAGYDHRSPAEAESMEQLEVAVLAEFGFGDPYEAR